MKTAYNTAMLIRFSQFLPTQGKSYNSLIWHRTTSSKTRASRQQTPCRRTLAAIQLISK